MTAIGRRTTVKPSKYGTPWAHDAQVVLVHTATQAWGARVFDLLVDDVKIGEVEAIPYTRERPTHRGSRIVVRGKPNAATQWLVWLVKDGKRVGGRYGESRGDERYWALQPVVSDYLRGRGAL